MLNRLKQHWLVALGLVLAFYGISDASHILYQTWSAHYSETINEGSLQFSQSNEIAQTNLDLSPSYQLTPTPLNQKTPFPIATQLVPREIDLAVKFSTQEPDHSSTAAVIPSTPHIDPKIPTRLVIPSIGLDAPIIPAQTQYVTYSGISYKQWLAPPKYAVGWHNDSAYLGVPGNTVLNGHHNVNGRVLSHLIDTNIGDLIEVYSGESRFIYQITNKMILPEKYQKIDIRMDNAQWIMPSQDERLTIITCWPFKANTHRLIIVAQPIAEQLLLDNIK